MTIQQSLDYDDAGNLTYDTSLVETVGGVTQLKLVLTNITPFSEDFTDDTDFTYDSSKAEFSGGAVQQKDTSPTNSLLAASYSGDHDPIGSNGDALWHKGGGSTVSTLNGAPVITAGKLVCTGSQGINYEYTTSAIETHKFKYTPDYTTSPPANVNLLTTWNGSNNNDRFYMTNSPSGNNIRFDLRSSTGVAVTGLTVLAAWNPTAGQEYEFEVIIDSSANRVRLFIDGVLVGTKTLPAFTRGGVTLQARIGASSVVYNRAEGSFDDYMIFTDAQHAASYTPGYTVPAAIYEESTITLPTFTYIGPGVVTPSGPPTSTETGSPRYIIQGKYWDGSAWSDSDDTYAQATSKADILANIATFPSTGASTIVVKVVLPTANTLSTVDQIDFTVAGELYPTSNPTVVSTTYTLLDGITEFAATATAAGSDEVKYLLAIYSVVGGTPTYKYWTGAAWADSDGSFAQSNTAAEINTNISSLDLSIGYFARFFIFLHSDDGSTTPSIANTTFCYNFFAQPSTPNECIIYGWLREVDNTPIAGTVTVKNNSAFYHSGLLIPKSQVTVTADSTGYWEASVVETTTVSKSYDFELNYTDPIAKTVKYKNVVIPDQSSSSLEALV